MPLIPRSVAAFYAELLEAVRALGIAVAINPVPVELPDPIPLDGDTTHASYDPEFVQRWWRIMVQIERILQRFRSPFVGKSSPINFFWGCFDLNATRFSGRPAAPPAGAPRFLQLAEDQENFACGFWPGNATMAGVTLGEPAFYAYVYPEPAGFREASVRPSSAHYDPRLGEFLLRYDDARQAPSPEQAILDFFQSTYEAAATAANWDRRSLERIPPRGIQTMSAPCTHLDQIRDVTPRTPEGCEECLQTGRYLGPPAPLPDLRPRRLLRQLEEQARDQALPCHPAPDHPVVRARARTGSGATSTRSRWSRGDSAGNERERRADRGTVEPGGKSGRAGPARGVVQ